MATRRSRAKDLESYRRHPRWNKPGSYSDLLSWMIKICHQLITLNIYPVANGAIGSWEGIHIPSYSLEEIPIQ